MSIQKVNSKTQEGIWWSNQGYEHRDILEPVWNDHDSLLAF